MTHLVLFWWQIHLTGCLFAAITKLPFLHYHNLTLKKTYAAVRVSVCLYLYVYLYVGNVLSYLLLCLCTLYVSPWESGKRFYRFLCMSDMQEIDNKATLTLTFTF